jgi:hypothetical protein
MSALCRSSDRSIAADHLATRDGEVILEWRKRDGRVRQPETCNPSSSYSWRGSLEKGLTSSFIQLFCMLSGERNGRGRICLQAPSMLYIK